MQGDETVRFSLSITVCQGRLERAEELIDSYGLSYSPVWSGGQVVMLRDQIVNSSLISAVRCGSLEKVRELLNIYGLSYSEAGGYVLLCNALEKKHVAIAKLLLTSGSSVNKKYNNPSDSPLHFAAINGDIEIVTMILDKGANVDAKNQCGRTPLHNAIVSRKTEVTELLLKHKADINARDNRGTSPLHFAVEIECLQTVKHLLKRGAYVNFMGTSRWKKGTPLQFAVERGSKEVISLLLSRGANVHIEGEDSITALHIAAKKGHISIAEDLLNHGACIDSLTLNEGYTPLHFASELGNEETVKLLLDRGADINASTKGNLTPLYIATKNGHKTVVNLLLQRGAKVDNQDKYGKTILHLAIEKGYLNIIKHLLNDVDVNASDIIGRTALHFTGSSEKGYLNIIKHLLNDVDVNASDIIGRTALHFTGSSKRQYFSRFLTNEDSDIKGEIAKLLVSKGANVDAEDKYGFTALHAAIDTENVKLVKALLKYNANVNCRQVNTGLTPLHLSVLKRNEEISIMLLNKGANVNAKLIYGEFTALHIATRQGDKKLVKVLLEWGAIVDSKIKFDTNVVLHDMPLTGVTALHMGAREGFLEIIETLLKFGADINITCVNNRTPLDHAMDGLRLFYKHLGYESDHHPGAYTFKATADALKRHIVQMKTANLYVSEENLQSMTTSDKISDFQLVCEEEIASMKSEKINNTNISYYNILVKDTSSLAAYMRNENIVQVLKSNLYKIKFPIYTSMIENNFRKAMERKELLEENNQIFHFLFNKFPNRPNHCFEKIFSYLSDEDLRILMEACKPLNISNPNTNVNDVVVD